MKEQGLQVQLMAKIYSKANKANRVIVWLGQMEPDSDQVLEDKRLAPIRDLRRAQRRK